MGSIVPRSVSVTLANVTFVLMFAQFTTLPSYILVFEVHGVDMVGGLDYKYLPSGGDQFQYLIQITRLWDIALKLHAL